MDFHDYSGMRKAVSRIADLMYQHITRQGDNIEWSNLYNNQESQVV